MNSFTFLSLSRRANFTTGAALCLLASVATSRVLAAKPAAPKSAVQLLSEARGAMRNTAFRATQTVQRPGRTAEIVKVWNSGGKRRYEFQAPAVRRGDIIVDNGRDMWIYHRSDNSAVQTRSAKRTSRANPMRNPQAKRAGSATIDGRKTSVLEVTARGRRRLWVDDKTRLPLRTDRFDARGARIETTTLKNVKFGAVPASTFSWTPPAGARITRISGSYFPELSAAQRAASWLQFPRALRDNFAFESAIVDGARGEAWLRYTNEGQRFSIFQQRAAGADKARRKIGGVWFWQRGGSRFTIVGLSDTQATSIIDGVK